MVSVENILIGAIPGVITGIYCGHKIGCYFAAREQYRGGKITERPTLFNSKKLLKKYINELEEEGHRLNLQLKEQEEEEQSLRSQLDAGV